MNERVSVLNWLAYWMAPQEKDRSIGLQYKLAVTTTKKGLTSGQFNRDCLKLIQIVSCGGGHTEAGGRD